MAVPLIGKSPFLMSEKMAISRSGEPPRSCVFAKSGDACPEPAAAPAGLGTGPEPAAVRALQPCEEEARDR